MGAPPSTSVEVMAVTAVLFSATVIAAVAPLPLLVITGASLTGSTVMVTVAMAEAAVPSLAV